MSHGAGHRVTIGANGDYPGNGNQPTAADVRQAIQDGNDWLVFIDDEVNWNETLDIDVLAGGCGGGLFLSLEGGAVDGESVLPAAGKTVFKKNVD